VSKNSKAKGGGGPAGKFELTLGIDHIAVERQLGAAAYGDVGLGQGFVAIDIVPAPDLKSARVQFVGGGAHQVAALAVNAVGVGALGNFEQHVTEARRGGLIGDGRG